MRHFTLSTDPTDDEDLMPEQRLLLAMIRQAIHDMLLGEDDAVQRSAFWWLYLDEGAHAGSLAWCCEAIGCTTQEVRLFAEERDTMHCWNLAAWFNLYTVTEGAPWHHPESCCSI